MTRKHFQLIADAMRYSAPSIEFNNSLSIDSSKAIQFKLCVLNLASQLKETNPRFDFDRFVDACVPQDIELRAYFGPNYFS